MAKAVNKEYLISSLKDFNEKVLSRIYAKIPKNKFVLDKLDEFNGKLTFNGCDFVTSNDAEKIKESLKDDIRKGYQQILDEDIEYCFATLSTESTLSKNTIYHFDNIEGNKMELTDDGNVRLKSGKLYCIEADINISENTTATGASANFYICDQDGNVISKNFAVSTMKATGIVSGCMEIPNTFIKPEVDISLTIRSGSVVGSPSKIVKAYLSVFEIKQPVYTNVNVASYADQVGHGEDTPVGQVISFMGTTTPENYLACDGAIYNIADYPDLSTFINTQFGSYNHFGGDGINTFAVPDLRGEFLRGTGTNSHIDNGDGEDVGVHQDATKHVEFVCGSNFINTCNSTSNTDSDFHIIRSGTIAVSGTSKSGNYYGYITSRPTNTSVMYCIKAFRTFSLKLEDAKIYSEEERVIGKWIDGKILYQKTVHPPASFCNVNNKTYELDIKDEIDTIFIDKSCVSVANEGFILTIPYVDINAGCNVNISVNGILKTLNSRVKGNLEVIDCTVVLNYTKK